MKRSHLLIAVLLVAVGVMVKIFCFPRPVMGSASGNTNLVIRIDPLAAAQIRAWRRARGLDPQPPATTSPSAHLATVEGDLGNFIARCNGDGHQAVLQRKKGQLMATCQ